MTATPTFRPADQITDPELFALARARWPGVPVTSAMIGDIATLENRPEYVLATSAVVQAGLAEVQSEQRRAQQSAATVREYARMGFDPARDYRNPSSAKE